ncbi:MAG: hypothetical protein WDN46_20580 [Methylocella sp.]
MSRPRRYSEPWRKLVLPLAVQRIEEAPEPIDALLTEPALTEWATVNLEKIGVPLTGDSQADGFLLASMKFALLGSVDFLSSRKTRRRGRPRAPFFERSVLAALFHAEGGMGGAGVSEREAALRVFDRLGGVVSVDKIRKTKRWLLETHVGLLRSTYLAERAQCVMTALCEAPLEERELGQPSNRKTMK